jgi:hypothetical protein
MKWPALWILVLALAGCDRTVHRIRHTIYAPTEAGLTLIYENPSITDSGKRFGERLQVRVSSTQQTPEGLQVNLTYTTLQGQMESQCLSTDGGWALLLGEKQHLQILPAGFPDKVSKWDRADSRAWVVGRGTVDLPDLKLPPDSDRIGVWVESESATGTKRRVCYLSGIGEVESLVLKEGKWICMNRLISRGFTDVPEVKPKDEPAPVPPPDIKRKAKRKT